MSGGGGRSSTVTSGINPKDFPELMEMLDLSAQRTREQLAGDRKIIADPTKEQLESLNQKTRLAEDKIYGRGMYDDSALQRQTLENMAGTQAGKAASGGTYGSARTQAANTAQLADAANLFNVNKRKVASEGVRDLGDVGTFFQEANQKGLDSQGMALDQFFNRINAGAPKTTTTTGGGK